jgi:dTDP-glucose 4,6-dehydratase
MGEQNTMRIAVTGGAGFIGSHFVKKLIDIDFEVVVIDNLITGKLENINEYIEKGKVTFLEQDVQNFIEVEGEIDTVVHLASIASPKAYSEHPVNTLKSGSLGTINSLGLAKAKRAKYLLASTSEVYGSPLTSPQNESYWGNVNPVGPRSMYDESKRFAEASATTYMNEFGLDVKIARIFNTYGTGMQINDGRVVTNFVYQALTDKDITIYGDGTQTRSLSYVSDTVEYLFRLMNSDFQGVMNIGNPDEIQIIDLANKIINKTDSISDIKFLELPQDDPKQRKPDITLAIKELEYEPIVSLEDGLDMLINWVRERVESK